MGDWRGIGQTWAALNTSRHSVSVIWDLLLWPDSQIGSVLPIQAASPSIQEGDGVGEGFSITCVAEVDLDTAES